MPKTATKPSREQAYLVSYRPRQHRILDIQDEMPHKASMPIGLAYRAGDDQHSQWSRLTQ